MPLKKIKNKYFRSYARIRYQYEHLFARRLIRKSLHAAPDFFIIGIPKSGTTSLAQYLYKHPDILPAQKKELNYFSWIKFQGFSNYLKNFPLKSEKNHSLTFDATPSYFYFKEAPKRIAKFFPEAKFIALLRDPVERAFSDWNFHFDSNFVKGRKNLQDQRDFDQAIEDEFRNPNLFIPPKGFGYLLKGRYAEHLKNWLRYFSKDQLLLIESSMLKSDPAKVLKEVTDFLELPPFKRDFKKSKASVNRLMETPDRDSSNTLKSYNVNTYTTEMKPKTKKMLKAYFASYDKELQKITGRTFTWME